MEKEQYIPQFDVAERLFKRVAESDNETERMLHNTVVRALAKARHKARTMLEVAEDWRPGLEDFTEDKRVLQRALEQAEIIQKLDSHLDGIAQGLIKTVLESDQIVALEDIYDFLLMETEETISKGTQLGRLTKSGHLDLATNWGKSVLIAELLNAIYADSTKSGLKTLILINSLKINHVPR